MSELVDLDGIEARAKDADEAIAAGDMVLVQRGAAARLAREDIPALVAEVRALRAKVAAAEALPPETAMEVPTRVRVVRVDDLQSALSRERPAEPPPYHFRVAEDGRVEPTR